MLVFVFALSDVQQVAHTSRHAGRAASTQQGFVTDTRIYGQYFLIWLQRQKCLDITSLFGYGGKSAWTLFLYFVTEARVPGYRGKSAWTVGLLLSLVTKARVPGHYFVWLQRQECLDITPLFDYKGKSAWTLFLYLVTETRVLGYRGKSAWTLLLCLVTKASVPGQSAV